MGEYNEVRKNLLKCKELINNNSHNNNTNSTNNNGNNNSNAGNSILFEKPISINEVEKLEKECDRCEKDEIEKEKKFHKQMGNKLKKLDLDEK